jgi:RHS repeat-associated protein
MYTAREYDTETGLYYYGARYYDPKAGRFIIRDPIGFDGGINQYAYVSNNPVNNIDPLGLEDIKTGGFLFRKYLNDHDPDHWHVFKDGKELGRFNTEDKCSLDPKKMKVKGPLKKALKKAGLLGLLLSFDWSDIGGSIGDALASPIGGSSEAW